MLIKVTRLKLEEIKKNIFKKKQVIKKQNEKAVAIKQLKNREVIISSNFTKKIKFDNNVNSNKSVNINSILHQNSILAGDNIN